MDCKSAASGSNIGIVSNHGCPHADCDLSMTIKYVPKFIIVTFYLSLPLIINSRLAVSLYHAIKACMFVRSLRLSSSDAN